MQALSFIKSRKHSLITLADGKEYKIPNEYSVQEVERLLEVQEELEAFAKAEAKDTTTLTRDNAEFKRYLDLVFMQIEMLLQHFHPEVTTKYLKSAMTQNEALEMLGFFQKYRHIAITEYLSEKKQSQTTESKKKVSAKSELRDLRRMITFMVIRGFSLWDLKILYIDELHSYYEQLIFNLEKTGEVKEGSYAKLVKRGKEDDAVNQIRKQMLAGLAGKRKKL